MEDKTPARLNRPTMVDGAIWCCARFDLQLTQEAAETDSGTFVPDPYPDRPVLIMHAHGNDSSLEPRICHSWHGEEELAGKEGWLVDYKPTMRRQAVCSNT